MPIPSFYDFKRIARVRSVIPIFEEIPLGQETPISAFQKIEGGEYAFLLESLGGNQKWGRFSFLGILPLYIFKNKGEEFEIIKNGKVFHRGRISDPLQALDALLKTFHPVEPDFHSLPFWGGAVGYINYDLIRSFERLPDLRKEEIEMDGCCFIIPEILIAFDTLERKAKIISNIFLDGNEPFTETYRRGEDKIQSIINRLQNPLPSSVPSKSLFQSSFRSNFTKEEFLRAVKRAKEYIRVGDVIQVVLSQRFSTDLHTDPFDIYCALRRINPSPYLFYLKMGDTVLLGSSPEVMVRLQGRKIELRPLAGTRKRGNTYEEDLQMERDLLSDEKERAEHIMLVDLGRNDVGRVAEIGTVRVKELMGVERYSHVMHLFSHIEGTLAEGKNAFDVLRATFPAGTVTGAPKIRAMEIIEELEPVRRGPYGGAVGYFSFSGNMDTCITIRSILIKDGKAYIQAGAGIVADSDPEKEYEETLNKAQAIFRAIKMAEEEVR